MRIRRIELSLLPNHLEATVHVSELEVGAGCWADVAILVDGGTQYYSLVEKIGDLLVFHFVI